jgi:hypothetical protein
MCCHTNFHSCVDKTCISYEFTQTSLINMPESVFLTNLYHILACASKFCKQNARCIGPLRACRVTPFLKGHFARNATHYLIIQYFQSLRTKKIETSFISGILFNATNVQNGHRFFLGKLQIDSNMNPLHFVKISGVICLISCLTRCLKSSILYGFVTYTLLLKHPHKKVEVESDPEILPAIQFDLFFQSIGWGKLRLNIYERSQHNGVEHHPVIPYSFIW